MYATPPLQIRSDFVKQCDESKTPVWEPLSVMEESKVKTPRCSRTERVHDTVALGLETLPYASTIMYQLENDK